jgi:glycosyltransferase involved in cell wall biosynthesis
MTENKKILFIKNLSQNPKFITNDIDILKANYEVKVLNFNNRKNILILFSLLKQGLYLLFNIWKFDLIYIWFADYLSFLPVLFSKIAGKKCVICAGGYEATYIPEINMGVYTNDTISKSIRSYCVKFSLKNCSVIAPVDETLITNINKYIYSDTSDKKPLNDGIKNFIPDIKTKFNTVNLGYDSSYFNMSENIIKEKSVVSAGLIINDDEFKRKGFDLLIQAANDLKDIKFVLIGFADEYIKKIKNTVPENIELQGILSYENLKYQYQKAKVYAQLSMFEGMPSAICEAMLCQCIPVGSNVNGIPKIIDECGFIVYNKSIDEIKSALLNALNSSEELGKKSREHIIKNFSLQNRKEKLLKLIYKLIN